MKNGLTELVFILDKSGSMAGLESDTIGGYNAMMKKQREVEGEWKVTTVLFNQDYEFIHDRIDLKAMLPMREKDYQVGGSTALLDAIGKTVEKMIQVQRYTSSEHQAEKVLFIIITDGEENSSCKYSGEEIRRTIRSQNRKYGWEFIFLGANIDAVEAAKHFGIAENRAQNYHADAGGVRTNFEVISETVENYRCSSKISEDWNKEMKENYNNRGE